MAAWIVLQYVVNLIGIVYLIGFMVTFIALLYVTGAQKSYASTSSRFTLDDVLACLVCALIWPVAFGAFLLVPKFEAEY